MRFRPFKSFLGTPLNLPTGKVWYEEDIINAQRGFVKQFESELLETKYAEWDYYQDRLLGVHYKIGGGTLIHYLLPATEADYNHYLNNLK